MATPEEFAAECGAAARGLRRVPSALRRALAAEVKTEVAVPLAAKVAGAAAGPWARVLSAGVKARASADPQIVVGGASPRLSGGAGPRQVVFGTEFGGGKRITTVHRTDRHRGYFRRSTRQFGTHQRPFVFKTVSNNMDWVLDRYADIVTDVLDEGVPGG
ncbi:hypothetical protein BN12_40056 [Nostocoides japonicum T1-X7]|uniref:Uncharacterized protein n=1 Tax=Nostocoides japonicum T1-X7 TaxID=1194083 RepID=A0A077LZR1_9MICO|nr:hypothetical protein [Tetrasphaera japonica]CCH79086.1 hypothetical protein BN12_40056 [Tetrasphaera japonica T1-X7]